MTAAERAATLVRVCEFLGACVLAAGLTLGLIFVIATAVHMRRWVR